MMSNLEMSNLEEVFCKVDWALLAQQKRTLVSILFKIPGVNETKAHLDGLLCFLDGVQDAAEKDGFPVVFLTEEEEEGAKP